MKSLVYNLRYIPIGLILIYQKIVSPLTTPSCRFYPSCSMYTRLAVKRYGILKGGIMSLIRISKCHPFHPGGYNPLD
ncbi:membrane protein insertion efficiency factor YidD [Deltaproteobacteria bacterium]|nr:membrane protein insertion efficiency factor YidD [Deltaproteobacteria bacterium]